MKRKRPEENSDRNSRSEERQGAAKTRVGPGKQKNLLVTLSVVTEQIFHK